MGGAERHFEQRGKSCESEVRCLLCVVCRAGWRMLLTDGQVVSPDHTDEMVQQIIHVTKCNMTIFRLTSETKKLKL
jgi:hypothetical protein